MNTEQKRKNKTLTLRIDENLLNSLNEQAKFENKTTANLVREVLKQNNDIGFKTGNDAFQNLSYDVKKASDMIEKSLFSSNNKLSSLIENLEKTSDLTYTLKNNLDAMDVKKIKNIGLMNVASIIFFALSVLLTIVSTALFALS